jgi:hypothetical protein
MSQRAVEEAVSMLVAQQATAALQAKIQAQETPQLRQVRAAAVLAVCLVAVRVRRALFM